MRSTHQRQIKRNKVLAILTPASLKSRKMKDFSNASFSPKVILAMQQALDDAVSTLPHPASSRSVQEISESILRAANEGHRDPIVLRVMALMTLQLKQ
jgi:hypothetical protein